MLAKKLLKNTKLRHSKTIIKETETTTKMKVVFVYYTKVTLKKSCLIISGFCCVTVQLTFRQNICCIKPFNILFFLIFFIFDR